MIFLHDLRIAVRSLARTRALWFTVAITLAPGIGANAAIFSVVRGVLLRPLANRDEDRLLYVRQSAPGRPTFKATCSTTIELMWTPTPGGRPGCARSSRACW